MLVLINGAYGYFTWQIVDETRNDRKVEFIEKKVLLIIRANEPRIMTINFKYESNCGIKRKEVI